MDWIINDAINPLKSSSYEDLEKDEYYKSLIKEIDKPENTPDKTK